MDLTEQRDIYILKGGTVQMEFSWTDHKT